MFLQNIFVKILVNLIQDIIFKNFGFSNDVSVTAPINKLLNSCLCQNKLSLNFSKTNYIIINKKPHKTCQCNFGIALDDITINRAHTVKYLGLFIDNNLK